MRSAETWSRSITRIGLVSAGAVMLDTSLTMLNNAALVQSPINVLILIAAGASGLALLLYSAARKPRAVWLILTAFLVSFLVNVWVSVQSPIDRPGQFSGLVQTDSAVYTDMAATLLLKGQNPYLWDYSGTMALYHVEANDSTPTLKGIDEAIFPYPALAFLLPAIFQLFHLPGVFSVLVISYVAVLILLFYAAPRTIRPVILIPTSVGFAINFAGFSLVGVMDTVWAGLLLLMMTMWRRPFWRAVLFGLAISFKQVPWVLAPFLLVRIWHEDRRLRDTIYFMALSVGTFLLVNSPFIVAAPVAWLQGVTEPVRDSLVLLSQGGLSTLTQNGLLYLPKTFYLIAVIVLLGLLLFAYWRHQTTLRDVIWLFPGIILWVSYRSIVTYWAYWLIPMLSVFATTPLTPALSPTQAEGKGAIQTPDQLSSKAKPSRLPIFAPFISAVSAQNPLRWRLTAVVSLATVIALVMLAIVSATPATIEVEIQTPVLVSGSGNMSVVTARLTNKSQQPLSPRFMVQGNRTTGNPVPWRIETGPLILKPGQSADYRIGAGANGNAWTLYDVAQLVVMDGSENSALRGVATLPVDNTLLWPDAIPNANYQFWTDDHRSPLFWAAQAYPPENGSAKMTKKADRNALTLTIDPKDAGIAVMSVSVQTTFPAKPFGVWIYSDATLKDSPFAAYGIELNDGDILARYQIGALNSKAGPQQYIEQLTLPDNQWQYVEIDPQEIFSRQNWPLPVLQQTSFRGVTSEVRLIGIRLFAAASTKQGPITVYFGPLQQPDNGPSPEALMAETLNDPAGYYTRLGDNYLQLRNYSRAITSYKQALGYSHSDEIVAKLKQAELDQAQGE